MENILDKMRFKRNRSSTYDNYCKIWKSFNKFVVRLDAIPDSWEKRVAFYCAYLVQNGIQSMTMRSYVSVIKCILREAIDYSWNDDAVIFNSLVRACKLSNDRITTRLPVGGKLLEIILFEVGRIFQDQPFLKITYQTILVITYYGLFRIGELVVNSNLRTDQQHAVKAKDVHVGKNKEKILLVLYSSKTHDVSSRPQEIKITSNKQAGDKRTQRFFCLFKLIREYMKRRGSYDSDQEHFFIFRDKTKITETHVREVMRLALSHIGLDPKVYCTHSLRIGRSPDMAKMGYSIDQIKRAGRWKSNTVYRYLKL